MISRRLGIAILAAGLCFSAAPAGATGQFLQQAMDETKEAIEAGKQAQSSSFIEHATEAVSHARDAVWQQPVEHIRQGIKSLRKAIKMAKGTSSDKRLSKATDLAQNALTHFEAAAQ